MCLPMCVNVCLFYQQAFLSTWKKRQLDCSSRKSTGFQGISERNNTISTSFRKHCFERSCLCLCVCVCMCEYIAESFHSKFNFGGILLWALEVVFDLREITMPADKVVFVWLVYSNHKYKRNYMRYWKSIQRNRSL